MSLVVQDSQFHLLGRLETDNASQTFDRLPSFQFLLGRLETKLPRRNLL